MKLNILSINTMTFIVNDSDIEPHVNKLLKHYHVFRLKTLLKNLFQYMCVCI